MNSVIKHNQKSQKSIEWWVSVWLQEPLRIIHLGSMCLYYKVMDHVGRLMSLQIDLRSSKEIRPELLESLDRCLVSTLVLVFLTYISYHPSSFSSRQGCLVIPRNDKGLVAIINLYGWSLLRPGQVALKAATCTYSRRIQDGKSENHSEHNTCWHITILGATQIRFPAIVKWWSHEPEFEVWDAFGNAANGQLWCVSQVPRLFWDLFIPVLCLEINVLMIQTLWTTCRINNMCVAWNMTASQ